MPSPLKAIMPINVDSTMITCFRSCQEKFRNEFIYGLRPAGLSIDLHAGACFASGIEAVRKAVYQKGKLLPDALIEGNVAFELAWGSFEIPDWKKTGKTKDRVWEALEAYFLRWPPLTDHFQPYYIEGKPTFETSFAIPLEPCAVTDAHDPNGSQRYKTYSPDYHQGLFPLHPNGSPWLYSGRFDMLGEYEKMPRFGDEKTSGTSASSGWADKWRLRNQFMGYTWACQQHGLKVWGGVVRGIGILKTKIDLVEATPMYTDEQLARWYEQLRRDMWKLRQAWDTGYFDYNFADTCTAYGNCMFMNICTSAPENKQTWMQDFEVRRWNPLIKNPIEEKAA